VVGLEMAGERIVAVVVQDEQTGQLTHHEGQYVFSTMPVKDLVAALGEGVPGPVREVAAGLCYRDFITVGILAKRMMIRNETTFASVNDIVPDNWIYVQERDVKLGRLQIFNNWSPYLVKDPNTVWIGGEYFCNEGDDLWQMTDERLATLAERELERIGIVARSDVLDSVVIRVPKTYPAYFGSYDRFDEIRQYTDNLTNLFLIGRNGMHRYNNQDHSMLTAMIAVDGILKGDLAKAPIWDVNAEEDYHEQK